MSRWQYVLALLIAFCNRLKDELDRYRDKRKQEARDASVGKLRANPADWYLDHFDGRLPDDAKAAAADQAAAERERQ